MKCPICKIDSLHAVTLQDNLPASSCGQCSGVWISSNPYQLWVRAKGSDSPELNAATPINPQWDTKELKLCPDCGHILTRFKIFANTDYYLDRCRSCNGIWFDHNEWQVVAERNLHDNLNEFFTHPWQEKLHQQEAATRMEELYLSKFGEVDYELIRNIRSWLRDNPHGNMLLAYLMAEDPYKI